MRGEETRDSRVPRQTPQSVCPFDCDNCHGDECPCDRLGCVGYKNRQEKIPHPTGDDGGNGLLWVDEDKEKR